MATCAVCRHAIVSRQDLVVLDTEVVHRDCARGGRETVGQQLAREIASLNATMTSAVEELRRQKADLERTLAAAAQTTARVRDQRDEAVQQVADLKRGLAGATRERDAARRRVLELEAERAALAAAAAPPEPAESPIDDAVQRFRLLELDP